MTHLPPRAARRDHCCPSARRTVDASPPAGHSTGPPMFDTQFTRNFCIIAHIDHGKTHAFRPSPRIYRHHRQPRQAGSVARLHGIWSAERGITIKAHPVTMRYTAKSGQEYRLKFARHPRSRRFRLRGESQPRRLRGGALDRRRGPRGRGADRRKPAPGRQTRTDHCPGHQQDRSTPTPICLA